MTNYYKYPRTPHLPWSPGGTGDDVRTAQCQHLVGKQVIVTEKMDGENTTMYCDHIHARSIDSRHHVSRDWVKQLHAKMAYQIPRGWRICGENIFARHAISYEHLPSYFMAFAIFDEDNRCLDWTQSLEWFELLGLEHPKVLYQGIWNEQLIADLQVPVDIMEGYVVRSSDAFAYEDFASNVAKWVRKNHVQTDQHWMRSEVVPNGLKELGK